MSMSNSEARKRAAESAVQAMKAEVWDEGYRSGLSNAIRRMSDEPKAPTTENPYRSEAVR